MYAALIGAGITAGYKYAEGRKQKKLADKLAKTPRPDYTVPAAEEDALKLARFNYSTNSTNVEQGALNQLDADASQQVGAIGQAATDSSSMLAALTAAGAAKARGTVQIADNAVAQKQQDLNSLLQQSNVYSQYKDKEFDWNAKTPYQEAMLAASGLTKASKENQYSTISDVSKAITSVDMNDDPANMSDTQKAVAFEEKATKLRAEGYSENEIKVKLSKYLN